MPRIDWNKIKEQSTIKPTKTLQNIIKPIETLQQPEIKTKGKIDWGTVVSKKKELTTEMETIKKIRGGKLPLTKTGKIDTRIFFKTPKFVLRYNKAIDTKITKQFQKEPASLLMRMMDIFTRLHPYEAIRDIQVDPEKYPNILAKIGHYFETIKEPKVSPALRGYSELGKGFGRRYGEMTDPIAFIMYSLGLAPEGYKREEYEKQVLEKGLPAGVFKVGEKTIDPMGLTGFLADVYGEPTGWALAGIGKLGAKAFRVGITKLPAVSRTLLKSAKKNLVGSLMSEITAKGITEAGMEGITEGAIKGLTGQQVFKSILRKVGTENWDEASTIFLNRFKSGWQTLYNIPEVSTKFPKGLSWVDDLAKKMSKTPIGVKQIEKLSRNFTRGYKNALVQDFDSVMKSLKIMPNGLDEKVIGSYIDSWYKYVGKKTPILKSAIDKLGETLTPIQRQGIDYFKRMNSMFEFVEKSPVFGFELNYKHIQNYLFNEFVTTGKKTAYRFPDLTSQLNLPFGKNIFTFEKGRIFWSAEEASKYGYKLATPFQRMKARIGLHSKAINYSAFLSNVSQEYGSKVVKEGYRLVKGINKLKGIRFTDDVATFLERGNRVLVMGDFTQKLIKVMTPITRTLKQAWTFTTGFHIRNLLGSHAQNYMHPKWGTNVLNPKLQKVVSKLAWTTGDYDVVIAGQKIKASLFREVFDLSGMGAGWFKGELGGKYITGLKTMGGLGEKVERQARMFSFYNTLNVGDNLIDAMLNTKLLHFDYLDGLTQAERIYGRLAVPFFSWYRFNTPLQLRFMIENPFKVSTIYKAWRSLGVGKPEETPEWFDNYIMGKVGDLDVANNIQKYLRLDIPLAQIGLLQPSYEALTEDKDLRMSERLKKLISPFVALTHPFIKVPFEIFSNFDTFRERRIPHRVISPLPTFIMDAFPEFMKNWCEAEEKKRGKFKVYTVEGEKAKLLEQIPFLYQLNVLSGYEKYEGYKEQKSKLDKISMLLGVKLYPVSLDYLQGKYKTKREPITPTKRIDWKKVIKKRSK